MTLTPIVREHGALRAIATVNGRKNCNLILRRRDAAEDAPPLDADDINLTAAADRSAVVARLEPGIRADAALLLIQLAEDVVARKVIRERTKPTTTSTVAAPNTLLDPNDPLAIARRFIVDRYTDNGQPLIQTWRGDTFAYANGHYRALEEQASRAGLYSYLEVASRPGKTAPEPFRPTAAIVNNVSDALRAATHLDNATDAPAWLDRRSKPPANELIAVTNGLLHYPSRKILPHSPRLFTLHGLPFAYDAKAGEPVEWLKFLNSVWPEDSAAIDTLQEIFGYILVGDRRQQKMFMLVGPKRAGKDTMSRILRRLVGVDNCAGPTLSGLAGDFGMQMLIGKTLAIIPDARLSSRADSAVIVERLLAITGGGHLSVERKHREAWTGELPTRFLMLSNELPRLEDASGALASRFIILTLTKSWYDREDTTLFDRLVQELPGILCWALDGLERLWERGCFTTPDSSAGAVRELEDLGSPIKQFIRERCVVDPVHEIETGTLYDAWRRWSEQHGKMRVSTQQVFGRDLRAAVPGIGVGERRKGELRWRAYLGIKLAGELL